MTPNPFVYCKNLFLSTCNHTSVSSWVIVLYELDDVWQGDSGDEHPRRDALLPAGTHVQTPTRLNWVGWSLISFCLIVSLYNKKEKV